MVLTNAESVRVLKPMEASQKYPVELRAVVTFAFDRHSCFVQDDTAGIFIGNGTEFPVLKPGAEVIVRGVTDPGEFAPMVVPSRVQIVGRGHLPAPRRATYDDLLTGREDSQWIELSGLVRAISVDPSGSQALEITTGGGRLAAVVYGASRADLERLVDSQVRVVGVCGSWFNRQRQLFGIRLLSPDLGFVAIEDPAPTNELTQSPQKIGNLLRYAADTTSGRRVKVIGTVVLQHPGRTLFVQDGEHGLYVQTRQAGNLRPGDIVELIGYPVNGEYTPMLEDAVWEKIGTGPVSQPVVVTPDEALEGLHDCQLVQINGLLLNRSLNDRETVLLLQNNKHIFTASLEGPDIVADLAMLQNQSLIRLTGVCRIEVGEDWRAGPSWRAKSFQILLRSPADIRVLKLPPWWTLARLFWAMGILTTIVVGSLAWVTFLRRRVNQQTAIIRQQLDMEAMLKERYQDLFENANDTVYTHDLSGQITSVNQAGETLLGHGRSHITEHRLLDFIVPEQRPAAAQWLDHILDGTAPEVSEWEFITAGGGRVRLEICTRLIAREGKCVEVEGIARDVTERRRLEKEILEISTREQRRIGHDLHDGICQQLAGIGFLSNNLADKLREQDRPEASEALYISDLVNQANKQTRGVARGLFPVRLEENGLVSALEELAKNVAGFSGTRCVFHFDGPVRINDHTVAHHIYYIAQEAILNGVKHGKAAHINVSLESGNNAGYFLKIHDDGVGLNPGSAHGRGMGIRIMKYRAKMIGGEVVVQNSSKGGTEVLCLFAGGTREDESKHVGEPIAGA